ncbi:LAMI_0E06216g1_1 [Lachancea mirantina]|uniref:Translation initiation factor IF-2, mitochondrial n=1 Tax=Lachancea mirantina TaxID=1230905 RepID=A0A1G4JMC1_9SACH|nr:LAMI_0E06216g1_1 [Lachancea mirantina]
MFYLRRAIAPNVYGKFTCRIPRSPVIPNNIQRFYAKKSSKLNKKPVSLKPVTFTIPNYTSVSNLSNLLNVRIEKLVRDLTRLGFSDVSHNYILSREYIELILQEYNYEIDDRVSTLTWENVYAELKSAVNPKNLERRPPIVTIMGHVDHGKTTILDYLRKTAVVAQESGGITQHIGAFQIETPVSGRKITFLDTPGHSAFLKMRQRGATITDIVVLVVSAEDSLMPQTLEAIKHVRASGNELIIAITKIDKISKRERDKAIDRVNNDLLSHDISIEKVGGDVQVIPISARTGENMDLLEESIVVLSDLMDLKAENATNTVAEGFILESEVKKTVGNTATVLITKGTLQKGKVFVCGNTYCKVRSLCDEGGRAKLKALPAEPVEVLGWKELPQTGDEVIQVKSEALAKKYVAKRQALVQSEKHAGDVKKINEQRCSEALLKQRQDGGEDGDESSISEDDVKAMGPKKINFIVKGDVSGSVEAIVESILPIGNDEVVCNVVAASVGSPNENDLKMAKITNSTLLCFNLHDISNDIINNKENVEVKRHNVIYKLIEDVTEILTENLKPIYETKQVATADIREVFDFNVKRKIIKVAGCRVTNGQLTRNALLKVVRGDGEVSVFDGKLSTLKQGKEDATVVKKGNECGVTFEGFEGFEAGDKLIVYEKVKVPRFL